MAIEFIGHKRNLLSFITSTIQTEAEGAPKEIVDLFCGTASVSRRFKELGYRVMANDYLVFCSMFAKAVLLVDSEPSFTGVEEEAGDLSGSLFDPGPYRRVLAYLNSLPGYQGFVYKHYSPASVQYSDSLRMYFSKENAARIDAIRQQIRQWSPLLTEAEEALLISDLIRASNAVSNIAGTYGCYLKHWKRRAKESLSLEPASITAGSLDHQVFCKDANELVARIEAPIVYADPPYTKRQYSAYYHIPETIAVGDEPQVSGKTGLRPWEEKASDYCYRSKAPGALADLVSKLNCQFFFLSYSPDGQIPHETILEILSTRGVVEVHSVRYKRYKSQSVSRKRNPLKENLYALRVTD